jgi:hypothetical protein
MANKSSSTYLENEVKNFLSQSQSQLANVVTQSIVNISNKIVQEQTANVINNVSAMNTLNATQIIVRNGAKFSVRQENNLKSTVQAVLNITQDNTLATNLSSQIKNDILASLSQNSDISDRLSAAATLLKEQDSSGEINGVINAISDAASNMIDSVKSTEDDNYIKNKVIQNIALRQDAKTNLTNLINNTVNRDIDQRTINNCLQNSSVSNVLNLTKIIVDGKNSSFAITQGNILQAVYKCMISSVIKSSDLQTIANNTLTSSKQDTIQGVKVENEASATASKVKSVKATSWLDSLSSGTGIIIIIVIVVCIIIFFVLKGGNSDNGGSSGSYNEPPRYSPYGPSGYGPNNYGSNNYGPNNYGSSGSAGYNPSGPAQLKPDLEEVLP